MGERILCKLTVQLGAGLHRTITSQPIPVEAYDVIDVTIPMKASDQEVQVQPGGAGQVLFMLITSDPYVADGDKKVSYKVNSSAEGANSFVLDSPQIFMGEGALAMLGTAPPTSLFFSNTSEDKDARVSILVGRKAVRD